MVPAFADLHRVVRGLEGSASHSAAASQTQVPASLKEQQQSQRLGTPTPTSPCWTPASCASAGSGRLKLRRDRKKRKHNSPRPESTPAPAAASAHPSQHHRQQSQRSQRSQRTSAKQPASSTKAGTAGKKRVRPSTQTATNTRRSRTSHHIPQPATAPSPPSTSLPLSQVLLRRSQSENVASSPATLAHCFASKLKKATITDAPPRRRKRLQLGARLCTSQSDAQRVRASSQAAARFRLTAPSQTAGRAATQGSARGARSNKAPAAKSRKSRVKRARGSAALRRKFKAPRPASTSGHQSTLSAFMRPQTATSQRQS